MKVALIHDYLNQWGGAERILETFLKMFPGAHLYTLLYHKERMRGRFEKNLKGTSFLDTGFVSRHHRPFIPFMPLAVRSMKLREEYDLIISDSAGYAKGIRYSGNPFHLSYCHTPLRYAWESKDYFANPFFTFVAEPAFRYLRHWDLNASKRPHTVLANSHFIAGKIQAYYGRTATVVYPPVDTSTFFYEPKPRTTSLKPSYYLAIGRLLPYKRFDLVVSAFGKLGLPLKIVGTGPEEGNIKSQIENLKAKNIELIPFIETEAELRRCYAGAKALIFPQVEDFGLVAAEAHSCGTPVIAYRAGGAMEIVKEGETGIFFDRQMPEDLVEAVLVFEKMRLNRRNISKSGKRFSFERFQREIVAQLPIHLQKGL